ncbi:C-type mannose receptor 2-like [Lineus longissimus]|uniref:C-type mannose receptor 2-like n=1 Tax=Lineus longissimus TaxID=88925 RepID=UPI002B4E2BC0
MKLPFFILLAICLIESIFARNFFHRRSHHHHYHHQKGSCKPGWTFFRSHCYKFFGQRVDFTKAEEICQGRNAHLSSITSSEEFTFLVDYFKQQPMFGMSAWNIFASRGPVFGPWVGITTAKKKGKVHFKWLDGSKNTYKPPLDSKHINGASHGRLAAKWGQFKLRFAASDLTFPFICKNNAEIEVKAVKKGGPACRQKWKQFNGYCYKFFKRQLKFWAAEKDCIRKKSHLTSIHSNEEFEFLVRLFTRVQGGLKRVGNWLHKGFTPTGPWVGILIKNGTTGNTAQFTWTDGSDTKYRPPMSMDNIPRGSRVARLVDVLLVYKVRDHSENTEFPYICKYKLASSLKNTTKKLKSKQTKSKQKKKQSRSTPTTTTVTPTTRQLKVQCATKWFRYDNRCHRYFSSKLSFFKAEDFCKKQGGHLSSIHSREEYKLLMTQMPKGNHPIENAWVGMKVPKDQTAGDFMWTDGSWNDYAPPAKFDGKPAGANAARLIIYRGKRMGLYDTLGATPYPFICQRSLKDRNGNTVKSTRTKKRPTFT